MTSCENRTVNEESKLHYTDIIKLRIEILGKMDKQMRIFLKEHRVEHFASLLELYGINSIKDVADEMNETTPDEIETWVQEGKYEGMIDQESKEVRLKYFAHDYKDLSKFHFKVVDTRKLKLLGNAAIEMLNKT